MEKGNTIITVPLLIAIGTISIGTLTVLLINIFSSFIMYEKIVSVTLKYMFILEEYGHLTTQDQNNIKDELVNKGCVRDNIKIECTETLKPYGDQVFLIITYNYLIKLPMIRNNNFSINIDNRYINMKVVKYGVSKI